jgi:hypothetical protein
MANRVAARVRSAAGRARNAATDRTPDVKQRVQNFSREQAIEAIRRARERGAPVADEPTSKEVVKRAGRAGMCGAPMNATLEPLTAPGDNAQRMLGVGDDGMAPVDQLLLGGAANDGRNPEGPSPEDTAPDPFFTGGDSDEPMLDFGGSGGGGDDGSLLDFGGDY